MIHHLRTLCEFSKLKYQPDSGKLQILLRDTKFCITGSLVWLHQTIDFWIVDLFPELLRTLSHYRSTATAAQIVINLLSKKDLEIQHRKLTADHYASDLAELPGVKLFQGFSGAPWKSNFREDALSRPKLIRRIGQEELNSSSCCPILTDWNPPRRSPWSRLLPITNNMSCEIINLWGTSPTTSAEQRP